MSRARWAVGLTLLAAVFAAGCNLLDPLYDEGSDVASLLEDARFARSAGDYDRAVSLLERALELEPSHQIVRLELGVTLMRRDDLNLLSLERVSSHLLAATPGRGADGPAGDLVCTFPPDTPAEPFDPRSADGFGHLAASKPTLRRVLELLNQPIDPAHVPAMPGAFNDLQICGIITATGLDYDRDSILAALHDRFESDAQVTSALVINAVALSLAAYVNLFEQPDLPVTWFSVPGGSIGGCVAQADYEPFQMRMRAEVARLGRALIALDLLMSHSGNGSYGGYVEDALSVYYLFQDDETNPCNPAF